MSAQGLLLIDVHDVLYDVSLWYRRFASSLRSINVVSQFDDGVFDPFPYASNLDDQYRQRLTLYLLDIGLNRGQVEEFIQSIRLQYTNWLQQLKLFPQATARLEQLADESRVRFAFFSPWQGESSLRQFLQDLGLAPLPASTHCFANTRFGLRRGFRKTLDEFCETPSRTLFVSRDRLRTKFAESIGLATNGLQRRNEFTEFVLQLPSELLQFLELPGSHVPGNDRDRETEVRRAA